MAAPSRSLLFMLINSTRIPRQHRWFLCEQTRSLSSLNESANEEKDLYNVYRRRDVQGLLRKITGFNVRKVAYRLPEKLRKPTYKLLTDEELLEARKSAGRAARRKLQMPPFMSPRKPIEETMASDPDLEGVDDSKHIFVDISFGLSNRERIIVVRDTDGTLRKANWEERDRMNQIYNPVPGQSYSPPHMFQQEHLERVLKDGKFMYVLDKACVQYEPDDPEYIRVTHRTYEYLNKNRHFEVLRSTRYFGPLAFYLTWYNKIDFLLIDMVQRELIEDAIDAVNLYIAVHPTSRTASEVTDKHHIDIIKAYCQADAEHKGELELTIQAYEESIMSSAEQSA